MVDAVHLGGLEKDMLLFLSLLLQADASVREAEVVEETGAPFDYVTANVSSCAGERGRGVGAAREEGGVAGGSVGKQIEEERNVQVHLAGVRGGSVVVVGWREDEGVEGTAR